MDSVMEFGFYHAVTIIAIILVVVTVVVVVDNVSTAFYISSS